MSITIKTKLNAYNVIKEGEGVAIPGENGKDGKVYIPSVDVDGNLSWVIADTEGDVPPTINIRGTQGPKGDKGDAFTYLDFTPQQLEALKGERGEQGPEGRPGLDGRDGIDGTQGPKGDKGDAFTFNDFTSEQLELLRGERGPEGVAGPKGEKGDPFTFEDFTPEQLELLRGPKGERGLDGEIGPKGDKGDPFTFSDFTSEQLELLRGPQGEQGVPGRDGEGFSIDTKFGELNTTDKTLIGGINEVNKITKDVKQIIDSGQLQAVGLDFIWEGTKLGIKKENEDSYTYVNLKGEGIDLSTTFEELNTTDKTVIGAINEINNKDVGIDEDAVINIITDSDFNTLNTKKKKIIEGINECHEIIINTNNNLLSIVPHEGLNTTDKTIIGAINELNSKECEGGGNVDFDITTEYESLTTTAKDLIGAINEVNAKECEGGGVSVEDIVYTNDNVPHISNLKEAIDDLISFKTTEKEQMINLLNKLLEV